MADRAGAAIRVIAVMAGVARGEVSPAGVVRAVAMAAGSVAAAAVGAAATAEDCACPPGATDAVDSRE